MKFIEKSLFAEYNIEPNIEKARLILKFQTTPDLRKILPIVVKKINDNKELFINELYSDNTINKKHNEMMLKFKGLIENFTLTNLKSFKSQYQAYAESKNTKDSYFYARGLSDDQYNEIMGEFIDSLFFMISDNVVKEYENLNNNQIEQFFNFLKDIDLKYIDGIKDYVCSQIDLMKQSLEDNNDIDLGFITKTPSVILYNKEVYTSLSYCINSYFKEKDLYDVNANFKAIFPYLKQEDKIKNVSVLNKIMDKICDADIFSQHCNNLFNRIDSLFNNYLYALKNNCLATSFNSKLFEEKLNFLLSIVKNGKLTFSDVVSKSKGVKSDPLPFISSYIDAGYYEYYKDFLKLFLFENSNYTSDIAELTKKLTSQTLVLEFIKQQPKIVWTYEYAKDFNSTIHVLTSPREIDNFLTKYAYMYFIDRDNFNDQFIKNVQAMAFSYMIFTKWFDESYINPFSYSRYTPIGEYIRDVLRDVPSDFMFGGQTVDSYLWDKFSTTSLYGKSRYSVNLVEYKKIFKKHNKVDLSEYSKKIKHAKGLNEEVVKMTELLHKKDYSNAMIYYTKLSYNSPAKSIYDAEIDDIKLNSYYKAVEYFETGKYDNAIQLFNLLEDFRDSNDYIEKCGLIVKESYMKAINAYIDNNDFDNALKQIEKLSEYVDTTEIKNDFYLKKKEYNYNRAVELYKETDFEHSKELFDSLSEYKDSEKYISLCNEELEKIKVEKEEKKKRDSKKYCDAAIAAISKCRRLSVIRRIEEELNEAQNKYYISSDVIEALKVRKEKVDDINNHRIVFYTILALVILIVIIVLAETTC